MLFPNATVLEYNLRFIDKGSQSAESISLTRKAVIDHGVDHPQGVGHSFADEAEHRPLCREALLETRDVACFLNVNGVVLPALVPVVP
jgi:hypothetical protein